MMYCASLTPISAYDIAVAAYASCSVNIPSDISEFKSPYKLER